MLNILPLAGGVLGLIFLAIQYFEPCSDGIFILSCGFGRILDILLAILWTAGYAISYRLTRSINNPFGRLVVCILEAIGFTLVGIILFYKITLLFSK
jgi:hypothetical protein